MIKNLFVIAQKILVILMMGLSSIILAQDLVRYDFNGNTNPNPNPNSLNLGNPVLNGFSNYEGTRLQASDEDSYIEFSLSTVGITNPTVRYDVIGISGWATIILEYSTNNGNSWTTGVNPGSIGLGLFLPRQILGITSDLPTNIANLKVRIRISSEFLSRMTVDNVIFGNKQANIEVRTNVNPIQVIPHLSEPNPILHTDFGTISVGDSSQKFFRIFNPNGVANLTISSIAAVGINPEDFVVSSPSRTSVTSSNSALFNVVFSPTGEGIRTAEIHIITNSSPSPYIFKVIGVGASCSLEETVFTYNPMNYEGMPSVLHSDHTNAMISNGIANSTSNSFGTRLYPNGNLYNSSQTSVFARNGERTINFGGIDGIDISNLKSVSINFKVAAFTTTNKTPGFFDNEYDFFNNGLNLNSFVKLEVQDKNSNWVTLTLQGSDNSNRYFRYNFNNSSTYQHSSFTNHTISNTTGTKYGSIRFDIPASAELDKLKFRIVMKSDDNHRIWLLDDVEVKSYSAIFKTYKRVGNSVRWYSVNGNVVSAPTIKEKAFIDEDFTPSTDITACECEVNLGKTLTVNNGRKIELQGKLINNGEFIINDGGTLLQRENEAINSGAITVKKNFGLSTERKQYNFISSPVIGQNMKCIFNTKIPTTVMYYNEGRNRFVTESGDYVTAKGFSVKEPTTAALSTSSVKQAVFNGVPFNGKVENLPVLYSGETRGFNLIGNPYPSEFDLVKFYDKNKNLIESTILFWDNRLNPDLNQLGDGYQGSHYAKFNVVNQTGLPIPDSAPGGTGTAAPDAADGTKVPTRYVKVAHAFMVKAKSTANAQNIYMDNAMRSGYSASPNFLGRKESTTTSNGLDRYWLKLKSKQGYGVFNAVVYFEGGQTTVGQDDSKFSENTSDAIFTIAEDQYLNIEGRPSFTTHDVVKLGYKAAFAGEYTISLDNVEGIFNEQKIYIKDVVTGQTIDISKNSYDFYTDKGEFTGRFEIVYEPMNTLNVIDTKNHEVQFYKDGEDFVVRSHGKPLSELTVYSLSGNIVYQRTKKENEYRWSTQTFPKGVYIIRVKVLDTYITKKAIF